MNVKLIIIGGVAGGATAAARARRLNENAEIILLERGEYVSFANCGLPYFIGDVIKNRDNLFVTTPRVLKERYNIDVRIFSEAVSIDRTRKEVRIKDHASGEIYTESYDKIILSPGAAPVRPPLSGIDLKNIFSLRSIPDTDIIKAFIDKNKPKDAVIVGGGFIGLEMAENLVNNGINTTIVEMLDQLLAPLDFEMAAIVQSRLEQRGVVCDLGNGVKAFSQKGERIIVSTDKGKEIECDMVILSIGVKPEIKLAKEAGLATGGRGGIAVNASMCTSDPDIFAVGDAVEVTDYVAGIQAVIPLAGPANKQGRIAADNALGRRSVYRGTQGTSIVKVFDLAAAATGANEKMLIKNNIPYMANYTHSPSHAAYYPGAGSMALKILFSPGSGRLLGAQIVGTDGVDKRIDVLATAIRAGMDVFALEELELAYAPPYSSAKDPVNIAGMAAANILKGDVESVTWSGLDKLEGYALLDLRNKSELKNAGEFGGAVNIPLNELRGRLDELDKSKPYVVFCAAGLRSYIGYRILAQNGFRVINLSGGYTTLQYVKDRIKRI